MIEHTSSSIMFDTIGYDLCIFEWGLIKVLLEWIMSEKSNCISTVQENIFIKIFIIFGDFDTK